LSQSISQAQKSSFQLFSVPVIGSVIIITLPITGTLNTPTFYHIDKTKAKPLGSLLHQWNLLNKGATVSFHRTRQ